jgi:topoisomerase-4 subunit A
MKILPHNFIEVLDAVSAALRGKKFTLYPDFPTGGLVDVTGYEDGMGSVLVRAKIDTSDPKRIVIRELPFGTTTESLIASIEAAAKKNKVKIASISDFTAENVEIEIKPPRGVYTQEVLDALYAFTDCESSIAVNLLVIKDQKPVQMTVTEVVRYYAKKLVDILTRELQLEQKHLKDKLHIRTLEQIFIEERIYKRIETMKTQEGVVKAVIDGFTPFASQIKRPVTEEDVEHLLKIPIRRISLYDINKAKKEMEEIKARLKEILNHLAHIVDYAVDFIGGLVKENKAQYPRRTSIEKFTKVDVRAAAQRNLSLRYDSEAGYLGYLVSGGHVLFEVSEFDKILGIRKSGAYSVMKVPDKIFVDRGMLYCGIADKDELGALIFSVVYKSPDTGYPYIKRCRIEQFILDKGYTLVPEQAAVLALTTEEDVDLLVRYAPKSRAKITEERFSLKDYAVKGLKAAGVRLAAREIEAGEFVARKKRGRKEAQDDGGNGES